MGLAGPGFIAAQHLDSVRRLGDVDVVAIAGSTAESAALKAHQFNVPKAYSNYVDMIADPDIQVVHITTPNYMHYPIALRALATGKHVICDKPLTTTFERGRELRDAALAAKVAHVVTFNYRGNSLVQQARTMVEEGVIGALRFIHGFYLQDWLTDPDVYSWRLDPAKGGPSPVLSDIGSHWCDLAEHITGRKIEAVLAELTTTVPLRGSNGVLSESAVRVEGGDLGSVLLRFEGGMRGCFSVGQTLPGHKNDLQIELNGCTASVRWNQENQNELWIGKHNAPNVMMAKDPTLVSPGVRSYIRLPGGHQESWSDAFYNMIRSAYDWIREGGTPQAKPDMLATFEDGYRSTCVIEAMLKSHVGGGVWERVLP